MFDPCREEKAIGRIPASYDASQSRNPGRPLFASLVELDNPRVPDEGTAHSMRVERHGAAPPVGGRRCFRMPVECEVMHWIEVRRLDRAPSVWVIAGCIMVCFVPAASKASLRSGLAVGRDEPRLGPLTHATYIE